MSKATDEKKLKIGTSLLKAREQSLFQRSISAFISNTIMSTEEMLDCKRVFREIDSNESGTIDFNELVAGLPKLSNSLPELTEDNVREIFNNSDQNKDG